MDDLSVQQATDDILESIQGVKGDVAIAAMCNVMVILANHYGIQEEVASVIKENVLEELN